MLSVILDSFVNTLVNRGMLWTLAYKNKLYPNIHYKFFVSMVRSDTEEADTLCGKYKTWTRNISQLCQQCYVPTMQASNHRANYPAKTQKDFKKLIRKRKFDQLQQISQHHIKNAWYKCQFNMANEWGIHGACPSASEMAILQFGIFSISMTDGSYQSCMRIFQQTAVEPHKVMFFTHNCLSGRTSQQKRGTDTNIF